MAAVLNGTHFGGRVVYWVRLELRKLDDPSDHTVMYTGSNNDRDVILTAIGGTVLTNNVTGYRNEDVNLDGVVKYSGNDNDRIPSSAISVASFQRRQGLSKCLDGRTVVGHRTSVRHFAL